jgi:hypothetical protein
VPSSISLSKETMVKVLICGDVDSNFDLIVDRINTLQNSKNGPFALLFFTGKLFKDDTEFNNIAPTLKFPMKAYAFDRTGVDESILIPENNLEFLSVNGVGLKTVNNLTIGFLNENADVESIQDTKDICQLVGYRGCDLLFTYDWPREIDQFLDENELQKLIETKIGLGIGSKEISDFAASVKPRYHFAGGRGCFFQRSPYHNENTSSGQISLCTR